jgi:hypothetical protein
LVKVRNLILKRHPPDLVYARWQEEASMCVDVEVLRASPVEEVACTISTWLLFFQMINS